MSDDENCNFRLVRIVCAFSSSLLSGDVTLLLRETLTELWGVFGAWNSGESNDVTGTCGLLSASSW
jgi:hypothetical protein